MTKIPTTVHGLLALTLHPAVPHVVREEGLITLLRPKFTSSRLQWLQRFLHRPQFKVKLDAVGSCLWAHMDGARTGYDLVEILRLAFGEKVEPADTRTAQFLMQLVEGGFAIVKDA